jgi:hypothetical protein
MATRSRSEARIAEPELHGCQAVGCRDVTRIDLLMCSRHWNLVPLYLQSEVQRTYRRGQARDGHSPSRAWHLAAAKARRCVASWENRLAAVDYLERVVEVLESEGT